jgi:uncharacterized membrane protein
MSIFVNIGDGGTFEAILVLTLLLLLILRELAAPRESAFARALSQVLVVGIVPLLIAAALITVLGVLRIVE